MICATTDDTSFIVTSTTTTQTSISSPKHINEWTWIYDRDTGLADYLYVNLSTITEEYNYVRERTDTFAGEGNKISYFEYTSPLVLVFGGILFVAIVILILKFDLFKRSYN